MAREKPDDRSSRTMGRPQHHGDHLPCISSPTDQTATPLWHSAYLQPFESAMRSTLSGLGSVMERRGQWQQIPDPVTSKETSPVAGSSANKTFIHPSNLHIHTPPALSFTPINGRSTRPPRRVPTDNEGFYHNYGRSIPGFEVDMHELNWIETNEGGESVLRLDETLEMDKDAEKMYHMGHVPGETYSGTFKDDDPDDIPNQALLMIQEIEERMGKPSRTKKSYELLSAIRQSLVAGATLTLQRYTCVENGEPVPCRRPDCEFESGVLAHQLYLHLESPIGDGDGDFMFCLRCFEGLWDGKYCEVSEPEMEEPKRKDSVIEVVAIPQLDGHANAEPNSFGDLFKSRHAVPEIEADGTVSTLTQCTKRPVCATGAHRPQTPDSDSLEDDNVPGSPSSTTSEGVWRNPPTRFQHIAAFVIAGDTLTNKDKALVELWQVASKKQLWWEHHVEKRDRIRRYYAQLTEEDESLKMKTLETSEADDQVDLKDLEAKTGVRKKDCNGRELSEVFKIMAENKGKV